MYEVGGWFIYLLDAAILAILGIVAMIAILVKRSKYQKEAENCIRAEVQLPTGWSNHYTVPCDLNAKTIGIENFTYILNPSQRRYGLHPMTPFLGLKWLQVPIRIESWFKDNPEPIRKSDDKVIATAAEIKAMTREIQATTAAMQIQEIDARQKELTNAISNQPNKMIVYIGLGLSALASIVTLIIVLQLAAAW